MSTAGQPDMARSKNVLLTGRPGIGKTTVIMHLAERLRPAEVAGFYTQEIREGGQRQGFKATTFSGQSTVLAHTGFKSRQRVGRYGVDIASFEQLVSPELARPADIMLIDEIGKMECFSPGFVSTVRHLLDAAVPVIATVAVSGSGFIAEVKTRPDVQILNVTRENRSELPQRVAEQVNASNGEGRVAGPS